MPTYDYKCDACGHAFEQFQPMSAEPIRKCPACRKNKVKRLIGTGAGLIFKGSGFYITDYRDASYKDKAKAESGAASGDGGAKSDGGAESRPSTETKADSKPADSKPAAAADKPASKSSGKPDRKSKK